MNEKVEHWCPNCRSSGEKCFIEEYPKIVSDNDTIPCDYCGKDVIIPVYGLEGVAFVIKEDWIMIVLLCLSCGGLNDLFYDFRESECNDYLGKVAPWKRGENYWST